MAHITAASPANQLAWRKKELIQSNSNLPLINGQLAKASDFYFGQWLLGR